MSPILPMIKVKCEDGHEWDLVIAPWWFDIRDIQCPECDKKAMAVKWKGLEPIIR
jgi:hypothetical protein